jgi:galactonate dehydratase
MVEGFWQVPTKPGLGIEVDMAACALHPFEPETPHTLNAVLDDGAIADW